MKWLVNLNWIMAFVTLPGFFMAGTYLGGRNSVFIGARTDSAIMILSLLIYIVGFANTMVWVFRA